MGTATALRRIPSFFLYGEAPRDAGERIVHAEPIAVRSARHDWRITPHLHRTLHQLIFVLRGRGVAHAEGARVPYRPPAVVVVPAGTVHGFEFDPGTHGYVVSMSDDLTREISQREPGVGVLFENPATLEFPDEAPHASGLAQSLALLAREFDGALPARALALEGLVGVVLAHALRGSRTAADFVDGSANPHRLLVARFREAVEHAYREGRSLADYAAALNVSQSRLRNACLAVTDQSPMQIVHARIVLEAKRRLLYTSLSVREIAYSLGFDDPAYFTRFFSRRTGASPSVFRRRGRPG